MPADLLARLSHLRLTPKETAHFGLASPALTLRRSWPRSAERIGLEYISDAGEIVPGQWFADPDRLAQAAEETRRRAPAAPSAIVDQSGTSVLLQGRGADRRLIGLASLLAAPGARLLVHRPESRAVVCLNSGGKTRYAKIVPPDRLTGLVENSAALERLAGRRFAIPHLLGVDTQHGVTFWSALPGTPIHDLLDGASQPDALCASGRALRNLHELPLPEGISHHTAAAEVVVVERWMCMLRVFVPQWADRVADSAAQIVDRLMSATSPVRLLHRDFYDKQIFWENTGQIGLLDFDTLAAGEAALDVANALAHFDLRAAMGNSSVTHSQAMAAAFLEGYAPDQETLDRLPVYQSASALRLLCVYAFRPLAWKILPAMLTDIKRRVELLAVR